MERRPLRMLVLEPDARLAALLRSTLEPEGFDVTVAASLAQMRSLPAACASDVVLVDEVLAASDGAAGLRSLLPVAATLLLTGASGCQGPDALRLMHDLGAAAFLRKPY